jgi:hypothetical protein
MVYPHVIYLGPAHPDLPEAGIGTRTRELDSRTADGIHVRLLWHPDDARVSVAVHDTKSGDAFELSVPDGTRALDVFHHPYAYAHERSARDTEPASSARGIHSPRAESGALETTPAHD